MPALAAPSKSSPCVLHSSVETEVPADRLSVARSLADVEDAWNLVYQTYLEAGLIDRNPIEIHTVSQAVSPEAVVALRRVDGSAVSTISAYADGLRGLPLDCVYRAELDELRGRGRRLVEVGLLADRSGGRSLQRLLDLMRFPFYFTRHTKRDDLVIGVHPHHVRSYVHLFGFEQAGPLRTYPYVKDHAVVLLRLDVEKAWSAKPMPRGSLHCRRNPLSGDAIAGRFGFEPETLAQSPLALGGLLSFAAAA